MTACNRPRCKGTVIDTGFCDTCGLAYLPEAAVGPEPEAAFVPGVPALTGPQLPPVVDPDPESMLLESPYVKEDSRFCRWLDCNTPVGRALPGQPAATEGFCHVCGTEFSFEPKLSRNEVVGGHYIVLGCLAHGGMGWIYLAQDRNLQGKYVVLKGLLNNTDTAALRLARNESKFLTELEHPNVVRIISVVSHPEPGSETNRYIVMDYVGGRSLRQIAEDAFQPGQHYQAEDALLYVKYILQALQYLHETGLLYCDMKPANVIYGSGGVKVIDFGGVRGIDDDSEQKTGTYHFRIKGDELKTHGLTVRSDIYTVGTTLDVLLASSDVGEPEFAPGRDSVTKVVDRAIADYEHRFASAQEMLVQVDGVLAELHSLRTQEQAPPQFSAFHEAIGVLDAGLGQPPALTWWTGGGRRSTWSPPLDLHAPEPLAIAAGLAPPVEDPNDPHTEYLRDAQLFDDDTMLTELAAQQSGRNGDSVELELRMCRLHIRGGAAPEAGVALEKARNMLGRLAGYDWRIMWHDGLIALAESRIPEATRHFTDVLNNLPGEEDPKLALGLCAELSEDTAAAERFYQLVWGRDRTQLSAAFGLARIRLREGKRGDAVRLLRQVSDRSPHLGAVRIAIFRIRCARLAGGDLPADADLADAAATFHAMRLHHEASERLLTLIRESALDRLLIPGTREFPEGTILGSGPDENGVRRLLEDSYRRLARQTTNRRDNARLVDLANLVRPMSRV
ncbi:MAG TPA: tetratricopeptide repeat protein [Mycobacteriales bacterium]|nr:tetratricopeptide repeat protein [Mycobacteriales bacterium]